MAKIDQAEFKRIVSAINDPQAPRPAGLLRRPPISKTRRAADKMFESVLTKAGLDVGKLGEMLAQDQGEVRGALQKQMASTDFSAAAAAYRQGIAARAKAIGLLKEPYTSTLVMLDTAFAIWELPHPEFNIFIGSDTGPMNNWIKVFVNEIAGNNATQFMFYFVWQNTSDTDVVINAASVLAPGGYCEIAAAPGFLSGDHSWLGIYANFRTIRWSGWGTDPMTGQTLIRRLTRVSSSPNYRQSRASVPGAEATSVVVGTSRPTHRLFFRILRLARIRFLFPQEPSPYSKSRSILVTGSILAATPQTGFMPTSAPMPMPYSARLCCLSNSLHRDFDPARANQSQRCLERFRAKWIPVRMKKTRQNKSLERRFRFNQNRSCSRKQSRQKSRPKAALRL